MLLVDVAFELLPLLLGQTRVFLQFRPSVCSVAASQCMVISLLFIQLLLFVQWKSVSYLNSYL